MKKSIAILIGLCMLGLGNLAFAQAQNEIRHTVQAGETAYAITKRYNITTDQLRRWNSIQDPKTIGVGSSLIVGYESNQSAGTRSLGSSSSSSTPPPAQPYYYTVKTGDTFYGIARAHNVSAAELKSMNSGLDADQLSIGQQMIVGYQGSVGSSSSQGTRSLSSSPSSAQTQRSGSGRDFSKMFPNRSPEEIEQSIETFKEVWKSLTKVLDEYRTFAVVVGVANYPNVRALDFCDDDAYTFYAHLRSLEGGAIRNNQIEVLIDENATKANIIKACQEKFLQAGPNDEILFYYAGHGVPEGLIPQDYTDRNSVLTYDEIGAILGQSKATNKIAIIDACHSGGAAGNRTEAEKKEYSEIVKNLDRSFRQKGQFAIFSSTEQEESLELSGLRHGLFTYFLIDGMNGNADANSDRIVTVTELFSYLERNVKEKSQGRQSPLILGIYDPNLVMSFVRRP